MAFALLSVFEPSIVKHIYELTKESKEKQIKVVFYLHDDPDEDPIIYNIDVSETTTIHDVKVVLCGHEELEGYAPDNLRLYVHQPWYRCYKELDDEAEIIDWSNSYDEFHLDTDG